MYKFILIFHPNESRNKLKNKQIYSSLHKSRLVILMRI